MTMDLIERMYAHMDWANPRLMALVERDPERTRPAMRLLSHLLTAENRDGHARLIVTLSEDAMAREVVYSNQSGRAFRTRVDDHGPVLNSFATCLDHPRRSA